MAVGAKWIALFGAVLLAVVVAHSGFGLLNLAPVGCSAIDPKAPPGAEAIVYSPQKEFGVNRRFCIAWKPSKFFKDELAAQGLLNDALAVAKAREKAAQDALDRLPRPASAAPEPERSQYDKARADLQTDLKEAQTRRSEAQAKLDAAATVKTLALFVDDLATPIAFDARVEAYDGWRWKPILLRAAEDAKTTEAKAWRDILSGASHDGVRAVKVSLGEAGAKLPRADADLPGIRLRIFDMLWLALGAAGLVMAMGGVIAWAWNTGLLRDRAPTPGGKDNPPFSLGRTQMALWLTLSLGGFLFIWLLCGQSIGVMNNTVISLIGISSVSGLAAIAIDVVQPAPPRQSQGFFRDLLSDATGVVLHRIQMFAWTLVLAAIFVWGVVWSFSFPDFDPALLLLAGLVNGVYLGFKIPEK